ncbi:MAG: SET domain-containing protein [Patescibacteria group bacterium]
MLFVKTYLDKSTIDGIGLFAGEDIKKGTKVVDYSPKLDVILTQEEFGNLRPGEQESFRHFGYLSKHTGKWHSSFDNIRFCNHSKDPNVKMQGNEYFAIEDIKEGQEIICDYEEFEKLRVDVK